MTNSLQMEHYFGDLLTEASVNYSFSENDTPEELEQATNLEQKEPFGSVGSDFKQNLNPYDIPHKVVPPEDGFTRYMGDITHREYYTKENEISADLNFKYNIDLSQSLNFSVKWGAKYKHKEKEYDKLQQGISISANGPYGTATRNVVLDRYWDELSTHNKNQFNNSSTGGVRANDFYDSDYSEPNFLGDRYSLENGLDFQKIREIDNMISSRDTVIFRNNNGNLDTSKAKYRPNVQESKKDDYYGNEDYYAGYIMSNIDIGDKITFSPGVRYEKNVTEYTGYRGNAIDVTKTFKSFPMDTVTTTRENDYFLPMLHLTYKPIDWLNIKAGYSKTLQRPNYNDITPNWLLQKGSVEWNNYKLKPEKAQNFDLRLSVLSDKAGLFTVGGFYKNIEDMIFWTGTRSIMPEDTSFFGLPPEAAFKTTAYARNNEHTAINYGVEVQWQSNFWYLPGMLSNVVLNVNYTRNFSEAKYFRNVIEQEYDENYNVTYTNNDTTYTSPMIDQPAHLLNLSIGYDYKGFSIRWAMRYKSRVFTGDNWYKDLRAYSTPLFRHDLSVKQQLPLEGLQLFFNVNNLTKGFDKNVINYRDYPSYEERYGLNANLGVRYQL